MCAMFYCPTEDDLSGAKNSLTNSAVRPTIPYKKQTGAALREEIGSSFLRSLGRRDTGETLVNRDFQGLDVGAQRCVLLGGTTTAAIRGRQVSVVPPWRFAALSDTRYAPFMPRATATASRRHVREKNGDDSGTKTAQQKKEYGTKRAKHTNTSKSAKTNVNRQTKRVSTRKQDKPTRVNVQPTSEINPGRKSACTRKRKGERQTNNVKIRVGGSGGLTDEDESLQLPEDANQRIAVTLRDPAPLVGEMRENPPPRRRVVREKPENGRIIRSVAINLRTGRKRPAATAQRSKDVSAACKDVAEAQSIGSALVAAGVLRQRTRGSTKVRLVRWALGSENVSGVTTGQESVLDVVLDGVQPSTSLGPGAASALIPSDLSQEILNDVLAARSAWNESSRPVSNEQPVALVSNEQSLPPVSYEQLASSPVFNGRSGCDQVSVSAASNEQLVSPAANQQTVSPLCNQQSASPVSNQQSVSYLFNQQSASPASNQQSVSPIFNQQSASPASNHQSVSPLFNQQSASPVSNQESASPASNQQSVSPVFNQQSASPASNHQCASPTSNQQSVSPLSNQDSVSPASNQQSASPVSNQQSVSPVSFVSSESSSGVSSGSDGFAIEKLKRKSKHLRKGKLTLLKNAKPQHSVNGSKSGDSKTALRALPAGASSSNSISALINRRKAKNVKDTTPVITLN